MNGFGRVASSAAYCQLSTGSVLYKEALTQKSLMDFRDTTVNLVRVTTARAGIAYFVP